MIKTFRGILTQDSNHITNQVRIRLSTMRGEIGYVIRKFQIINKDPRDLAAECIGKVFTVKQDTVTDTIDFSDSTLLAVSYFTNSDNPAYVADNIVIFDAVKFNQDIYLTIHSDHDDKDANYYLELEQFKLDLNEATVATLKDMRGTN